jgi:hypothetical protein
LSVIVISAFRVPEAVGEKTTVMEQWPPTGKVLGFIGQVLLSEKSPPSAPVMAMLAISNGATPVLVKITVRGVLGISKPWGPKLRLVGERLTAGPSPTSRLKTVPALKAPPEKVVP